MTTNFMGRMRRGAVLAACAGLLATPACGTDEIAPPARVYVNATGGPDLGAFVLTFAPGAATFDEEQAWAASGAGNQYALVVDGALLVWSSDEPMVVGEGSQAILGYLPAGQHHFAVAAPSTGSPIVALDVDIVAGAQNQLYLCGPRDAIQARLVSYPTLPAPGTMHVSAVNLIQGGTNVEVVSCPQGASCTSLSPPLALGDAFEADFPTLTIGKWPYYTLPGDATLGLREVPTAALTTPPVEQLAAGFTVADPSNLPDPPANMVMAPLYVSADGSFLALYE